MVEIILRLVFSLAVVVGLLLLLAKVSSKRFRGSNGAMIRVIARQPLTRSSAVAVVNVADRLLVVGTTENEVRLLTELDPDTLAVEDDPPDDRTPDPAPGSEPRDAQTFGSGQGALAGSILSPQTWKQAMAAATQGQRSSERARGDR
jgi:flagellar protein FliO/FliZ